MLALLAILVFSPTRILPDPFLPNRLEPILPVAHLAGVPRASVTRGGGWRPGGFVRINYHYRFPAGTGPTIDDFEKENGFAQFLGFNGNPRVTRNGDGVRQVVSVVDLDEGIQWKWAKISGPARVVTVSEFPEKSPRRWHRLPELERMPIPPGYPPAYDFLKDFKLEGIYSDSLIPRGFRTSFTVMVKLIGQRPAEEIWIEAEGELREPEWVHRRSSVTDTFGTTSKFYGLVRIEVMKAPGPNLGHNSEILLTYLFADQENSPRIE